MKIRPSQEIMKNKILILLLLLLVKCLIFKIELYSQQDGFIANKSKTPEDGKEYTILSKSIDTCFTDFYNRLKINFGEPESTGNLIVWDSIFKKRWSALPVTLTMEVDSLKDTNESRYALLFTAKNQLGVDLLIPDTKSFRRIRNHLNRQEKIVFYRNKRKTDCNCPP